MIFFKWPERLIVKWIPYPYEFVLGPCSECAIDQITQAVDSGAMSISDIEGIRIVSIADLLPSFIKVRADYTSMDSVSSLILRVVYSENGLDHVTFKLFTLELLIVLLQSKFFASFTFSIAFFIFKLLFKFSKARISFISSYTTTTTILFEIFCRS